MSISRLLLFEEFDIHSTLPAGEILARIRERTDTDRSFYRSLILPSSKKYIGRIGIDSFTIWRRTTIRNFFRPLIKGKLFVQNDNVRFRIRLHMSALNLLLILPVIAFAVMFFIAIVDYGQIPLYFLPLLFVLPVYIWALLSLKAESANVKAFLSELLSSTT